MKSKFFIGDPYLKSNFILFLFFLHVSSEAQITLYEKNLKGGVTGDGYNLNFNSGYQTGIYNIEIPTSVQTIDKAYLTILFTGHYLDSLPQQFDFDNKSYTISQPDIKTNLVPTVYADDQKAYIAAIDVTRSIHKGQNIYEVKFLNFSEGSADRLISTYLTVIYSDSKARQINVSII